ncbi:MAG: hypothetical protein ACFFC0_07930 [Promethearchaeota archaeon]
MTRRRPLPVFVVIFPIIIFPIIIVISIDVFIVEVHLFHLSTLPTKSRVKYVYLP